MRQRSSASANCNDEQVGKNRQAGPGRERERERERTNPAHDSTPPSTSASRRSRRRRLTRTVEIVDERAIQDIPGRDPPPLLRTVPLPIHQKLVAPAPEDERQAASVPCKWKTPHQGQEVDGWDGWEYE